MSSLPFRGSSFGHTLLALGLVVGCGGPADGGEPDLELGVAEAALPAPTLLLPARVGPSALTHAGYLSCKLPKYGAKGDGIADDTKAIQRCLDDAYAHMLAAYLPTGTYNISDTLIGKQIHPDDSNLCVDPVSPSRYGVGYAARDGFAATPAPQLVGAKGATRPKLNLVPVDRSFDAGPVKPMVHFYNTSGSLCAFRMVFANIDLDTNAHPSAAGLKVPAAQHSSIEDVRITATGSYGGIVGNPSRGTAAVNVEVLGGRFGIISSEFRGTGWVGLRLIGQTESSIRLDAGEINSIVGFWIEPAMNAAAITINDASRGAAFLYDGVIKMPLGTSQPIIRTTRNGGDGYDFFVGDTAIRTDGTIYQYGPQGGPARGNGAWQQISAYSYSASVTDSMVLIDGAISKGDGRRASLSIAPTAAPAYTFAGMRNRTWKSIPAFDDQGVVDVVADHGANNRGTASATKAIQAAIRAAEASGSNLVFLPRGDYLLTAPITLGKQTRLFGLRGQHARLLCGYTPPAGPPSFLIQTTDDVDNTSAAYLGDIEVVGLSFAASANVAGIDWRAGERSWARNVIVDSGYSGEDSGPRSFLQIRGNGGGKWFNYNASHLKATDNPGFRGLLIDGVSRRLDMYSPNAERPAGSYAMEIRNSKNVALFGIKHEPLTWKKPAELKPWMRIANSSNVLIGGCTGVAPAFDYFKIEGYSDDLLLADLHFSATWFDASPGTSTYLVRETFGGATMTLPPNKNVALVRRGDLPNFPSSF